MIGPRPTTRNAAPPDQRGVKRLKTFIPAEIISDHSVQRVHVLNLSSTGALIHVGAGTMQADTVVLRINGVDISSAIIWNEDSKRGIVFDTALTAEQRDRMIGAMA